ncbi:cytochrome oxidase biogenesis protein, Cox20 subunit [Stemphylium lycopersici]|uniref:Cytochrome c oxidase assembly protein COX20, mitochondrial n=1 Tax=Stemphylium lycopersici TaxID=183478 RepID=A0A364N534_STELY|nr:cytochrome oxidase biogenesis protein, Cox20 subunit [Stemphylium lycopersici]
MSDDTRETVDVNALPPKPRAPANVMPGGTAHTAGGEKSSDGGPSYIDAVRSLGPEYYLNFHKRPCVRDSQLQGLAAGFAGGSLAAIIGKPVITSSNWAVATWCGVSVISYQVCQYYRSKEKAGIRQAQDLMEKKRASIEAKKEARRRARDEQDRLERERRAEEERKKSWGYWYQKNVKFCWFWSYSPNPTNTTMPKRKATTTASAVHSIKRTETTKAFLWKPKDWELKRLITEEVSLLLSRTDRKALLVVKILKIAKEGDAQPLEITILARLPDCNRVVKPLLYRHADPDLEHGTALFQHYMLGDLQQWKQQEFDNKNSKPIPESFMWRCFLQISQALAFIQGQIGPERDERGCIIHRDIKPANILVVNNGTTYPSFKLHDFGCATFYRKSRARKQSRCGTFQWQPPENHTEGINTRAADVWALGACIHFLATGQPPIEDSDAYAAKCFRENDNQHPASAEGYSGEVRYYRSRVPRRATPINLCKEEKQARGIGPEYHQYSDELNDWMMRCLNRVPSRRPSTARLVYGMGIVARSMLRKMGGTAALGDMEAKFGDET